ILINQLLIILEAISTKKMFRLRFLIIINNLHNESFRFLRFPEVLFRNIISTLHATLLHLFRKPFVRSFRKLLQLFISKGRNCDVIVKYSITETGDFVNLNEF